MEALSFTSYAHYVTKKSLVEYLLTKCQCDPNCLDSNGRMPLQLTSDLEIMKTLVEHGAKMTADVVFKMISSRHITETNASELLASSTKKGTMLWNPNDLNSDGDTALHYACKADKIALVQCLLSIVHCDPNVKSTNHEMLIQLTSDLEIMNMLVECGAKITADVVFKMISSSHITETSANELFAFSTTKRTMLWNPTDLNIDGDTALHLACKLGKAAIVNYLLTEAKCYLNAISQLDMSPLDVTEKLEIAKFLIRHGARVTPELVLRFEAMENAPNKSTLIELVLTTWNPNDVDSDGYTALHLACKADRPTTVNLLLSVTHCDPNIKGGVNGYSALHLACEVGNPVLVEHLLSLGHCDPNNKNYIEEVPLQLTSNLRIMKILVVHSAQMTSDIVFKLISEYSKDSQRVIELFKLSIREQCYGIPYLI